MAVQNTGKKLLEAEIEEDSQVAHMDKKKDIANKELMNRRKFYRQVLNSCRIKAITCLHQSMQQS